MISLFCNLTSADVVRHPLVQKIVRAYEEYENRDKNKKVKKNIRKLEKSRQNGK